MKWKIAVLCGGDSSEREVSLETGEAVARALDARGHYVRLVDVRGRSLDALDGLDLDAAFIALHGTFGEDGQVQLLLETRGIPYTGSGVEASRLAMDKPAAKQRFAERGVPTPPWAAIDRGAPPEQARAAIVEIGFPQVIKPAREGSSVGVTVACSVPEATEGLEECFRLADRALIEERIRGRELTVGVLGGHTLPVIELVYPTDIFDYEAKYTPGTTRHVIRRDLPEGTTEQVRAVALQAHHALGCRDLSRVDLMLGADGTPWVLEVNTVPGMTATSLVPDAARAAGIEFPELCETILRHALKRAGARPETTDTGADEWATEKRP
jgi:D-alanine-D-alanine ligase